ncbi:MAG: hypothetical protein Q8L98_06660 [Chlamydiales bacterium]|nr:hypothetical protein [Chlamydiales bacterium]
MSDKLTRMSIDIDSRDHKKIKMKAAKKGVSIREFVIDCIQDKMDASYQEKEYKKRKGT